MGKDEGGKGGVVVNIASTAGLAPFAGCPVYVATKHAVIGFTRSFGVSTVCSNVDILY
jgi:15-hydroxyprostaglandin dehydrogenase (NAD)